MNAPVRSCKQVIIGDPAEEPEDDAVLLRLTYAGQLLSGRQAIADRKQQIRKLFHAQLKRFWDAHPVFKDSKPWIYKPLRGAASAQRLKSRKEQLGELFPLGPYKFVPIVCSDLCVDCSLEILFLRPERPGDVWHAGDLDNRVKTLIDALRKPQNIGELGNFSTPAQGEELFFVLLEDDRLITRLSVETDMLLEPTSSHAGKQDCRLVITASFTPYVRIWGNMSI